MCDWASHEKFCSQDGVGACSVQHAVAQQDWVTAKQVIWEPTRVKGGAVACEQAMEAMGMLLILQADCTTASGIHVAG